MLLQQGLPIIITQFFYIVEDNNSVLCRLLFHCYLFQFHFDNNLNH